MCRMGGRSRRFDGFFKSEFRVNEAVGRSVSYVRDGKLLGGNSGFAHIGSYRFEGDTIAVEVTSRRHNFGADFQSLLGQDISTVHVKGQALGDAFHFEGGSPQMPTDAQGGNLEGTALAGKRSIRFEAVLNLICGV
jgi:hypothetical protein